MLPNLDSSFHWNDKASLIVLHIMKRQYVNSTSIRSIGYDESAKTLEVKFIDGDVYQYFKVPEKIYHELLTADSIGAYLNKEIKGKFEYRKIE
jgi:hypothetical protein